VHAEADVHDTALKMPVGALGFGVDRIDQAGAPDDGSGGAYAGSGTLPGRRRQSGAAGDWTGNCRPGTPGENGRQAAGVSRRWAGGGTAKGRAGAEDALAVGVVASIAPATRATAAKTAAHFRGRN
jgi:hypothetical protein